MRALADLLNGNVREELTSDGLLVTPTLRAEMAEIIAALGGSRVGIPAAAAERFSRVIGAKAEISLTTRMPDMWFDWLPPFFRAHTPEGVWGLWLVGLFGSPHRDRLRRCQQCARWFVDETRNKSQRRCSRACTIAWWSARQRPKGGK
jgi:hypothetical protein